MMVKIMINFMMVEILLFYLLGQMGKDVNLFLE